MINLLKTNFKILFTNKKIIFVFSICIILGMMSILFVSKLMINERYYVDKDFTYEITFNETTDLKNVISRIEDVGAKDCKIFLNQYTYVSYPASKTIPIEGERIINNNEVIIGRNDEYKIGDYFSYNDIDFVIVGFIEEESIELSLNEKIFNEEVYKLEINEINNSNSISNKIKEKFVNNNIVEPINKSLIRTLFNSILSVFFIGIMALSLVSFIIGYVYFFEKRKKAYNILNMFGINKYMICLSVYLEVLLITIIHIIVCFLLYVLFDKLVFNSLFSNIYLKEPVNVSSKVYFLVASVYIIVGLISITPSIVKFNKKCGGNNE